ncbi:class I adenylate-forming enzyme family protein [Chelatococcus asaccharovorans]|uniref:3-methylmercaptopropionyl-CoA ligase n=1 Tax=Chelatococcus asaccharovorans TaxID=28210 RepID=A0A2V3TTB9_9HYPH|nr:AMP-binding protein [Chelatococcus asaccharovorans]MBS7707852.1 AMP-binding protein [Chelatococcus asaccharovorans]PXW50901.1 fatty-acyl-CoA synthase [Chelatococcus asaccharovorans]
MMQMDASSHVTHNASRFPAKIALIQGERKLTYRDLDAMSNRVANALVSWGTNPGDRVAMVVSSSIEWVVAYIGVLKAGCTAVPLNYRLTAKEIGMMLEDSGSRLVFVNSELIPIVPELPTLERKVVIDTQSFDEFVGPSSENHPGIRIDRDETQCILYTGGTTGRSKGVMLTHENIFWNTIHEIVDTRMHEDDNTLLMTPLHHAAALNCWLLPHLYLGATATIMPKYSPEEAIRTIEKHRVTNAFTPPSVARDIFNHELAMASDLSSFRRWYVGGANLSRNDRDKMHALIPGVQIFFQYGLTEAGVIVTVLKEKDYEQAPPGSIGRAFLNFEVKILTEELMDAPLNEVGEIAVRGPSVMKGYFNNPEATAATFHEGWLRTGDMGAMDENGFVRFHDRLKDMVKTGGLNVYSQEVEQVLLRHPSVREAAILGFPSEKWGEEVTAVIVCQDDAEHDEQSIIAHAKGELAGYKVPKRIIFIDYADMPINYSGKIAKRELRDKILPKQEVSA